MRTLAISIDHVAVSGLPAAPRSAAGVGHGIEQGLGRLLAASQPAAVAAPGTPAAPAAERVSVSPLRLPPGATDAQIAEAVAAALHRTLVGLGALGARSARR
jgi:hypothetical protein